MQTFENDIYRNFIFYRTYARFREDLGRRESWQEAVDRYMKYMRSHVQNKLSEDEYKEIKETILKQEVMPSMRLLWAAGGAAEKTHATAYNCSFIAPTKIEDFGEILYLLTCGCGVGFSCESHVVEQLPIVLQSLKRNKKFFQIPDSREGWAKALVFGMKAWYNSEDVEFDYSLIRPAGAPLKTMGGRACLTGDTVVYRDRKKSRSFNEITIRELYEIQKKDKRGWFKQIKLRSLDEETGVLYRNKVVAVYNNGVAPVYEIITRHGYKIKATDNHRFLDSKGDWKFLSAFSLGDDIAVNGATEKKTGICVDCGTSITRRAKRCKDCFDIFQKKDNCLLTSARRRKECQKNKKSECEQCGVSNIRLIIHHKDENPRNNNPENLQTLCERCHRKHHFKNWTFSDPYSHKYLSFDEIISIDLVGQETVYDLEMEEPNHNFVANGFISHNSGPDPLKRLLEFTRSKILSREGKRLRTIDVHDIICKIGEVVVAGGVRRTSEISLSDLGDVDMRDAKKGAFWETEPQRTKANNSAVYTEKPTQTVFMEEWIALMKSGTGERGIFNRGGLEEQMPTRRWEVSSDHVDKMGTNPCGEITLRSKQFCNLTEVIAREKDTKKDLLRKIRVATILGTFQSSLTDFKFLSKEWKKNCEEERLLGVSITGQFDCPLVRKATMLRQLKEHAVDINRKYAKKLGINPSTSVTCVKPSGTVSQLVNTASGMHPRFSKYYIRRVRISGVDPLYKMLVDQGLPVIQDPNEINTYIFEFPIASPKEAVTNDDLTAIQQLEHWKMVKENYTEHNPSNTIFIAEDEWLDVGAWIYKNWDIVGGLSFLPKSDHIYELAPYEKITKRQYDALLKSFPSIDFSRISEYEQTDNTEGSKELACSSGTCEIV